ncbi:hypothetical protein Salmuc_05409 [Salipiger mucosus DSM 16094]|uniref:Uncharacterized protein n=1 Tax=Salipiger mucosus DSM 16094 TaxID=1123237 RepID=S9Q359_9RHOB|nr:hypothetical protein Salmuc_05409 [Salipiger mucosus DSM 16094]
MRPARCPVPRMNPPERAKPASQIQLCPPPTPEASVTN